MALWDDGCLYEAVVTTISDKTATVRFVEDQIVSEVAIGDIEFMDTANFSQMTSVSEAGTSRPSRAKAKKQKEFTFVDVSDSGGSDFDASASACDSGSSSAYSDVDCTPKKRKVCRVKKVAKQPVHRYEESVYEGVSDDDQASGPSANDMFCSKTSPTRTTAARGKTEKQISRKQVPAAATATVSSTSVCSLLGCVRPQRIALQNNKDLEAADEK